MSASTISVVLLIATLLSAWGICLLLYEVIKQQGRMLLRLDDIEQYVRVAGAETANRLPYTGVAVGTPVKPFRLPDLSGREVSLEEYRGKRILLINWNPDCGFCRVIVPVLAKIQADLHKRNVQVVLAAAGDAESNRKLTDEYHLDCLVLLRDSQDFVLFEQAGTPAAYLVDEQGRIAEALAIGAEEVPKLARQVAKGNEKKPLPGARPLNQSRIERTGIRPGTPAPNFRLPDIYGRPLALEELRGRKVLLVFTDPRCGPCDEVTSSLARMRTNKNELSIVMVGRGDRMEILRKAEQFGIEFPVLVQEGWRVSKDYGMFATPVAFLIDERGVIAQEVAQGPEAILSLVQQHLRAKVQVMSETKEQAQMV